MTAKTTIPIGTIFGELTYIKEGETYRNPSGKTYLTLVLQCSCGKTVTCTKSNVLQGKSKSCGCKQLEATTKHGMSNTNIRLVYKNMKARCDNPNMPNYKHYGARGITYSDEWKTFKGFLADMYSTYEQGKSLDRIDVDGNYTKENCRWATNSVQSHNRRKSKSAVKSMGVRINRVGNFTSGITIDYRTISLGTYSDEISAAKAYDDGSQILYGDRPNRTEVLNNSIFEFVFQKLKGKDIMSPMQLGYASAYRQGSLEDNPFPEDTDDYDKWLWGFENASNEISLSHYNGSLR